MFGKFCGISQQVEHDNFDFLRIGRADQAIGDITGDRKLLI